VLLGPAASFLPSGLVKSLALALFLVGAVILFREGRSHHLASEDEAEIAAKAKDVTGWKAVLASFLVLFAAEWGDLSQLLTISLVGRYDDPLSVFVGAWGALLAVSGLAVLSGRFLLRYIRLSLIHWIGAAVCLVLAGVTAYELVAG
jgi:putative Ca2+/H+ antiporter (TMEM165/GDT1 family)